MPAVDVRVFRTVSTVIKFTLKVALAAFCGFAMLFANVRTPVGDSGQLLPVLTREAAGDAPTPAPGNIVEIPGIGPMELTFVNSTGYQGRINVNEKLEVDIAFNFKSHSKYTPTDEEINEIEQSDFPMLNLQRTESFPDAGVAVSQWNFLTPIDALSSDESSLSITGFSSYAPRHNVGSSDIVFVADSDQKGSPVTGSSIPGKSEKKAIDTVEGTIMEIWKLRGTFKGMAAEEFHNLYKYSGWALDLAIANFESSDMKGQIQKARECVQNQNFASEENKRITLHHIDMAEDSIRGAMLAKFVNSSAWKVFSNKNPAPWLPLAKLALSKFADSVTSPVIKHEIEYINKIANCSGFKVKASLPNAAECRLLLRKNLKNFAQNGCLQVLNAPALQKYVP